MSYDNKKTVSVNFEVQTHQGQCDEMISCYIPSINTYFSANTWEDVDRKTAAMINIFINFMNENNVAHFR